MSDACIDSGKFMLSMSGILCILTGIVYTEHHIETVGKNNIIGTILLVLGWLIFMYSLSLRRDKVTGVLKFNPESNKNAIIASTMIMISMVLINKYSSNDFGSDKSLIVIGGIMFVVGWLYFIFSINRSNNTENITFVDSDSSKLRKMLTIIGASLIIISTIKMNIEREGRSCRMIKGTVNIPLLTIGWMFIVLSTSMRI